MILYMYILTLNGMRWDRGNYSLLLYQAYNHPPLTLFFSFLHRAHSFPFQMAGNDSTSKSTFHPAFSVSNIKNHIQITLEMENVHYDSWAELFFNVANAFDVADRIIPLADATVMKDTQWSYVDAIVKQWIYGNIR